MRTLASRSLALISLGALAACNAPDVPVSTAQPPGGDGDRYHARSFSWAEPKPAPLAKAAARSMRFATPEAFAEARRHVEENLRTPGADTALWKPLDASCPTSDLALWNAYGTVYVGDSLVLDESILETRCMPLGGTVTHPGLEKASLAIGEAQHRVHPYKLIGRAWSDLNLVVRSTGAETQFKKDREFLGVRAWWDTDATRIGVRLYLLDCGGSPEVCFYGGERDNWQRNSALALQGSFVAPWETRVATTGLPAGVKRMNLRVSAAVVALHSADHAGIQFRATSTAGISPSTPLLAMPATRYVTW